MALPRYRIIDERGAYMSRSPEIQLLSLGTEHNDAAVMGIRAPVFEMLVQGDEVEFDGTPGPHLEPLNDAAREKVREYQQANPNASLDPTRSLGLSGGNSININDALMIQMDRLMRESEAEQPMRPRDDTELTALRAQVAQLSAQVTLLLERGTTPARGKTT